MKEKVRFLLLIMLAVTLAGCSQWAVTPSMALSRLGTQPEALDDDQKAALVAALDPTTAGVLEIYPLWPGSTWVYQFLGFDESAEYIWHVREKVLEARVVKGYYLAKITRTAECVEGDPPDDFLNRPETGIFWYLIDGDHLYFFEDEYDLDLSNAWLDLIIPFPGEDQGWYPHPELRGKLNPGQIGYRYASEPYKEVLPIGETVTCYHIPTNVANAKTRQTFCEGIGFMYKEYIYFERDFGYRVELVGFVVQ